MFLSLLFARRADNPLWFNSTEASSTDDSSIWWSSNAECPLLNMDSYTDKVRLITELIQLTGAFLYIVAALREMKFLGYHMFIENLVSMLDDWADPKFNRNVTGTAFFHFIYFFSRLNLMSIHVKLIDAIAYIHVYILDDGTISSNVSIFVLFNDDHHSVTYILPNRIRRSCMRCDYADNSTIFFILLQVSPF